MTIEAPLALQQAVADRFVQQSVLRHDVISETTQGAKAQLSQALIHKTWEFAQHGYKKSALPSRTGASLLLSHALLRPPAHWGVTFEKA